ncbi:unnamed protein product [Caenorhabditis angaria]|uniref:SH3 domain-containing protein n=1 Tax=Caenorhabditis angaria TaxID=860376 RepID=A0A9P1IWK0_9PELO|nr:unnamed protein product [Caenorhabditis angaria]
MSGISQVSLVHSSDSIRAVPGSSGTLPRMSKPPPVRIPQQIHRPQHVIPTMSVQPINQQQHQQKYQQHPHIYQQHQQQNQQKSAEMLQRVRAVRRQVADEESELRRLRELENETAMLRMRNVTRERELTSEVMKLGEDQAMLRNATLRVQQLTRHLEEMYKRRQTAAAAALVEHRKMHQQQNAQKQLEIVRPRASVEPFQVTATPQILPQEEHIEKEPEKIIEKGEDLIDGSGIPAEPAYLAPGAGLSTFSAIPVVTTTFEQKINSSTQSRDSPSIPVSFGDSLDESKLRSGKTDLVSLRSDSLKATKRRSWAASEGTSMSEAEMIHRLLDEQRRGRSHFIPQLPTPQEEPEPVLKEQKEVKESEDTTTEESCSSTTSARSEDEESEIEEKVKIKSIKGILRRPNEKMNKGRIEFDPLALLLDSALEGELDLVRTSAEKLGDVSLANDEGITALHNAICAGHYEIVRFLIEHDADVNAQDSDGWTPLHCAASCNNLPMVRQLVEGGGCVLASTLSDMETPIEKCEEEEDGYDGCLKYLLAAHNSTGTINEARVYAAYSYEAGFEDELSFEAGDELVVLSKDDVDKHWWTCRKPSGETGLVPRTYLALYPALKYRKNLNFVMFDLPLESNNNNLQ